MERRSKAIFGFDLNDPPLIVEKKTRGKNEKKKRTYRADCTSSKRNKLIADSIHFLKLFTLHILRYSTHSTLLQTIKCLLLTTHYR